MKTSTTTLIERCTINPQIDSAVFTDDVEDLNTPAQVNENPSTNPNQLALSRQLLLMKKSKSEPPITSLLCQRWLVMYQYHKTEEILYTDVHTISGIACEESRYVIGQYQVGLLLQHGGCKVEWK